MQVIERYQAAGRIRRNFDCTWPPQQNPDEDQKEDSAEVHDVNMQEPCSSNFEWLKQY